MLHTALKTAVSAKEAIERENRQLLQEIMQLKIDAAIAAKEKERWMHLCSSLRSKLQIYASLIAKAELKQATYCMELEQRKQGDGQEERARQSHLQSQLQQQQQQSYIRKPTSSAQQIPAQSEAEIFTAAGQKGVKVDDFDTSATEHKKAEEAKSAAPSSSLYEFSFENPMRQHRTAEQGQGEYLTTIDGIARPNHSYRGSTIGQAQKVPSQAYTQVTAPALVPPSTATPASSSTSTPAVTIGPGAGLGPGPSSAFRPTTTAFTPTVRQDAKPATAAIAAAAAVSAPIRTETTMSTAPISSSAAAAAGGGGGARKRFAQSIE